METLESTLSQIHDWSIDRIHELSEEFSESLKELDDAFAIQQEFAEWLNPNISDHDILSLEYIGDEDGGII